MVATEGSTMTEPPRASLTLRDGRQLEYLVAGEPDAPAVVVHHGTPGSALLTPGLISAAEDRGLRSCLVSLRLRPLDPRRGPPGRGGGRRRRALLDALGVERFATIGWSGGGPHALACAALLPARCAAALSVAGVAPYLPGEFDWTEGMSETNVDEFETSLAGGPQVEESLGSHARTSSSRFGPRT